jgi:hypothetical protein
LLEFLTYTFLELLSPDTKSRIKVKEIFDHPWFRYFEHLELEKAKKTELKRNPSHNIKLSEFDYSSNQKHENYKIIISNKNVIVKNSKCKHSSSSSLINIENNINQEGNPNPIDSYKSSIGFNQIAENIPLTQNFVQINSKNKLNIKDLKIENQANEVIICLDNRKVKSNNNNVLIGNYKQNEEAKFSDQKNDNIKNKEYETIETIETNGTLNQTGKTKIIIKKKKKVLISKTSTYNETISTTELMNNHLLEKSENPFIENYKGLKFSSVLNKNKLTKLSNKSNKKESSFMDSFNDFKSYANKLSEKILDESNQIHKIREKLNDSKIFKNHSKRIDFASEQIEVKNKNLSTKTSNDILLGDLSPNNKANRGDLEKEELNNFNSYRKHSNNSNTNKLQFEINNENGYDLENFIEKQNSKKSKITNHNSVNCKSPGYKETKLLEKFNSKSNIYNNKLLNILEKDSSENLNINKFQNDNFYNYRNEDDNNKFSKLMKINIAANNKNNMDKSMDRSFNDISRDQIKEKINYKKNKSILNALNKTQNEIEKFDNAQMNSCVIDVVFSKIDGKNKNKNKHKDYGIIILC